MLPTQGVQTAEARPECDGSGAVSGWAPLFPAGVREAPLYTCAALGNICAHNGKGGWKQRLTVKPDRKRWRPAIRR